MRIMKVPNEVEHQLSRLGMHNRFWGKPEMRELQHILTQNEIITSAVNGRYEGGFALLVSTDRRLLLIDKKVWFLSLEDVRYDMIFEIDYCARLLDSTIFVRTINKILRFTSIRQRSLRVLTAYVQDRVMDLRHQTNQPIVQQLLQPTAPPQLTPPPTAPPQQFYAQQPAPSQSRPIQRIGAYPTASLTMQRRFSNRPDPLAVKR